MAEVEHRQEHGLRPGGEDDLVGLEGLAGAVGLSTTHARRAVAAVAAAASRPVPRTRLTLAFLSSTSTLSRIWVDDPLLAVDHLVEVGQ